MPVVVPAEPPYRQGDLDSLCGLYAIINAMRIAMPDMAMSQSDWRTVFEMLVLYTDDEVGAANALSDGLGMKSFRVVLDQGAGYVADNYGIGFKVDRPLKGKPQRPVTEVLDRLGSWAGQPGTAIIVAWFGHINHWTVLAEVGPKYLTLHDSGSARRVGRGNCRMSYEASLPIRAEHVLMRSAVVRLRAD